MNGTAHCKMALLVQADFDGELDAAQAAEVETHRAGCAACQATLAELQRVRATLRDANLYSPAPDTLQQTIVRRIGVGTITPSARPSVSWLRQVASFGFGAAAAAVIAFFVVAPGQGNLVDDVVAGHVRSLQPGHLQDVASTDQHTVKPWFDGRLDFAPPVKDFKDQGFPLEGGRLDYLDGRPVAALVYGRDKHQINVFVWPATGRSVAATVASVRNGYNVIHLVQDGMNLWMVSDVEKSQLAAFAQLWQAN